MARQYLSKAKTHESNASNESSSKETIQQKTTGSPGHSLTNFSIHSSQVIQRYPPRQDARGWYDSELGDRYFNSRAEAEQAYMAWRASLQLPPQPTGTTSLAKQPNVPAKVETEFGSKYTATHDGLSRAKHYGGVSANLKSIFYASEQITSLCQKARNSGNFKSYKIEPHKFGTVKIRFFNNAGSEFFWATLNQAPNLNDYPIDMILKEDGSNEDDDRFHIGDKIVKVGL